VVPKTFGQIRRSKLAMPGMQAHMTPVIISTIDQTAILA
jgi:hypothetical protein